MIFFDCFPCVIFLIRKKIKKSMGTACICYKQQQPPQQLQPLDSIVLEPSTHVSNDNKRRFAEIRNEDEDEQSLSELNLNNLQQELQRYVVEFQTKNGVITHRFTQRTIYQPLNQEVLRQIDPSFQNNKENIDISRKNNDLYLPLAQQNAEEEIEHSFNSYGDAQMTNNKSCLLTLSSRVLNQSLFTERATIKQQFYAVHNQLGKIGLLEWCDNHRLSYQYELGDIACLKQKYFDSKVITCLSSFYFYWEAHFIHLLTCCSHPSGMKLYLNGQPKMLPFTKEMPLEVSLLDIYEQVIEKVRDIDIADLTYLLTGWMPEHIHLTEIKNLTGILERLANNLVQGNTLVTFTRETKLGLQYATLLKIDFETGLVHLDSNNKRTTIPDILIEHKSQTSSEMAIKFQNFIELYDVINLNWNPYIYDLSETCEAIINHSNKNKHFLLVIPSSSQDLQIRLFLQRHQDFTKPEKLGMVISLYEYNGTSDLEGSEAIRTMETEEAIFSDVFIFQYCKEKTQYLLSVEVKDQGFIEQKDVYFNLTLYSFAEMKFKELQAKPCLKTMSITASMTDNNVGYGINSPYFNKNLQFSVETTVGQELQIIVDASNNLTYQICLIPDPLKEANLTKLKLQNIINNSQISTDKTGRGSFFIKAAFTHYLFMINSYSSTNQQIHIDFKIYGKRSTNDKEITLKVTQLKQSFTPLYTQEIKWLPSHFGPRKRLKSNSINQFQSAQVFTQFFKNPIIDKKLAKGTYQFFIKSQTFRDYFDSVETYQDKNSCQPPALSMAMFLASEDKQSYKIIIDDAYYVPFGVGFWTPQIQIQEGTYRFVLPKMDKGFGKGIFGVIKN